MHELSICQSLLSQVEGIALQHNAQSVSSIQLALGPLSGVEIELLKNAYSIASAGTVADSAELIIKLLPLRVKCNQCHAESEVLPNKLTCKQCGDWRTTVVSGDELILMSVELDKDVQPDNSLKQSSSNKSFH